MGELWRLVRMIPLAALLGGCVGYGFPGGGYSYGDYGDGYYGGGYGEDYGRPSSGTTFLCESNGNRTRECSDGGRGGVRLVRKLSDSPCIEGHSWGRTRDGVWVSNGCRAEFVAGAYGAGRPDYGGGDYGEAFRCEFNDKRPRHCPAGRDGNIRLVRQLSDTPCVEGRSWGQEGGGVWVSGGCRAEFRAGRGDGGWNDGSGQTVRCESIDNRRNHCGADVRGSVQLVRKLSDSGCRQGRDWDWDRGGIWVDNGCRAEFRVY